MSHGDGGSAAADFIAFHMRSLCSICFDRHCDFSLPGCLDQFCRRCMEQYLADSVDKAWGVGAVRVIKCPACSVPIPFEAWRPFANNHTVRRYREFSRPYRSPSRVCSVCLTENFVLPPPVSTPAEADAVRDSMQHLLRDQLRASPAVAEKVCSAIQATLHGRLSTAELYLSLTSYFDMHDSKDDSDAGMGASVGKRRRRRGPPRAQSVLHLLQLATRLERDAQAWSSLLEVHRRHAVQTVCTGCDSQLCFLCGEPSWHRSISCEAHLAARLSALPADQRDEAATLSWKLENGKRCPTCAVIITRDEGCNKVDCLHCGHEFCWVCVKPWSIACGFFRCASQPNQEGIDQEGVQDKKAHTHELGVPDTVSITSKLVASAELLMERRRSMTHRRIRVVFIKDWLVHEPLSLL